MEKSEHPDAAVVRSAHEALSRGDMAAFAGLLHEDIVWHESAAGLEGDYRGRSLTARYADVSRGRDHKLAEHWHLAFDPTADAAFMVG